VLSSRWRAHGSTWPIWPTVTAEPIIARQKPVHHRTAFAATRTLCLSYLHFTLSPLSPQTRIRYHVLHDTASHGVGAARYVKSSTIPSRLGRLTTSAAKPMTALQPFRAANAAFISSTSSKPAEPTMARGPALVKGNPPPPPPMKAITGKDHREVPLPSQEGTKGVMQYALYVGTGIARKSETDRSKVLPWTPLRTGPARVLCGP